MKLYAPNHREAFGYFLNEKGLIGKGAEIGCAFGAFARTVLSQWKGDRYYMVDPWIKQDKEVYRENTEAVDYDDWLASCQALEKEDSRVVLLRGLSVDRAKEFQRGELDWAYIDGNHAYGAVMADLDAWWPKVKIGGILGGHDFRNKTDEGWFCEVEAALLRWRSEHNVVFTVSPCSSWWLYKDRE